MYSSRQKSAQHEQFWMAFGKYMAPVLSASGGRISWGNYRTGVKPVYFRMHVSGSEAYIAIEIEHNNPVMRTECFMRFHLLRESLVSFLGEEWHWEEEAVNANGKKVSRIYKRLEGVDIHAEDSWPAIISFLKPRLVTLDAFWYENREFFESFT